MRKKEELGVRFDWEMIDDASPLQVAQQKLWKRHLTVVENMRTHAEQLIRVAKDTIKKIDKNGIDGYYSANHDCRQWAERLHYSSHEAQILRGIRVQIDRDCGIIEQLKETSHGPQDQTAPPHPSDGRSSAPDACGGGDGERGVLQERGRPETVAASQDGGEGSQTSREQEPMSQEGEGLDDEHASNTGTDEERGEPDQEPDP